MPDRWYGAAVRLLVALLALVVAWTLATSAALAWPSPAGAGVVSMPTRLARLQAQAGGAATLPAVTTPAPAVTPAPAPANSEWSAGEAGAPSAAPGPAGSPEGGSALFGSQDPQRPDLAEPVPVVPPRLLLPTLELDQQVVDVPISEEVWNLDNLGQLVGRLETTGAYPGADLAMTFVGHVRLSATETGPFASLGTLAEGDSVIYRASGRDYIYRVVSISTARPEEVARLYVPDGDRLLLVTCSSWSYFWREYARRLIVEAELVGYRQSP